ncbi:hypothetical protein [Mycobacterium hackensackense]|nr:hypothetical protein [Mycobacterium hackensackense]
MDEASNLLNLDGIDVLDVNGDPLELSSAYVADGRLIISVRGT